MISHMYSQLKSIPLKRHVEVLSPVPQNVAYLEIGEIKVK